MLSENKEEIKLIAFYLPQFHQTEVNDKAWGEGFTEWTNVAKARPLFEGHYQPHIPGKLGFYDLTNKEVLRKQCNLAKENGLYAFCFYYYWFDGRRELYKPLEEFFESSIDFHFCLCWANENWSKRWDGGNHEIIIKQEYENGFEKEFIRSVERYLKDSRYVRVNGKPLLLLYRPALFSDPADSIKKMREEALVLGIGEIEISIVDVWLGEDKAYEYGADSLTEFPPHQYLKEQNFVPYGFWPDFVSSNFTGCFVEYGKCILESLNKWNNTSHKLKKYRGIIPGWDNTARKPESGAVFLNNSPELYGLWLKFLLEYSKKNNAEIVFINAWNEWGEGCHLEPDLKYGSAFLGETRKVTQSPYFEYDALKIELAEKAKQSLIKNKISSLYQNRPRPTLRSWCKTKLRGYPKIYSLLIALKRKFYAN